jgi:hypothetical protein
MMRWAPRKRQSATPSVRRRGRRHLLGTTATRSPSCSRRTALTSRWLNSASRSQRTRRATISMRSPPTIRSRSPVALSSSPAARRRRSAYRMLSIYEAANEDPDAFRVTSRYIVATAQRPP